MYFNDMMFNSQHENSTYYQQQLQTIQQKQYQVQQDINVADAVKALHDLCEAVKKMDLPHQQQAFMLCLEEMAKQFGW